MNVTIAINDKLLARAREVARRQGTSLNALVRQYLEQLAGEQAGEDVANALMDLMNTQGGHSGGRHIAREEAYEGRA
ncbi:MAG TPA: DUF6364 family protein [Kofleriaceae bacterium]|nr:DUF6364 family protein [Kofleriaceae bacterium]